MAAAFSGPDVPAPWGAGQLGTQQGDEGARGRAGVGPPHRVGQTPVMLFQRERDHAAHGAGHGLRDDAHTQVGSDQFAHQIGMGHFVMLALPQAGLGKGSIEDAAHAGTGNQPGHRFIVQLGQCHPFARGKAVAGGHDQGQRLFMQQQALRRHRDLWTHADQSDIQPGLRPDRAARPRAWRCTGARPHAHARCGTDAVTPAAARW